MASGEAAAVKVVAAGGAEAWGKLFTPSGKRRQKGAWAYGSEMSMWTASN